MSNLVASLPVWLHYALLVLGALGALFGVLAHIPWSSPRAIAFFQAGGGWIAGMIKALGPYDQLPAEALKTASMRAASRVKTPPPAPPSIMMTIIVGGACVLYALPLVGCPPNGKTVVDVTNEVVCVYDCAAKEEEKIPPPTIAQVAKTCAIACAVQEEKLVVDLLGARNRAATRKLAASPCAEGK